jgi:UDP:flavonoid glycosyltransferase YjiC (YdhE family)
MRFLFCAFSNPGLLFPQIGLARELVGRGHEAAFAAGPAALPFLESAGLRRIPRPGADGDSLRIDRWSKPLAVAIDVKHVEHAVDSFRPDVLVGSFFGLGAMLVRERTGIPLCVLGQAAYLYPPPGGGPSAYPACDGHARWRAQGFLGSLNDARALFGLPALDVFGGVDPLLGDRFLVRSVPELEDVRGLPPQVRLAGACEWEPAAEVEDPGVRAALDGARAEGVPVLYAQIGRTFGEPNFWPHLLEALADRPVRVFASTGRMDCPAGSIPANFVVRDHLPQGAVLPRADGVVSGVASSVMLGALAHGVPTIAIPGTGGEAGDNAARMQAAGCALRLDPQELTAAGLREAIDAALRDDALRRATLRIRDAFGRVPGFARAADFAEALGAPVPAASAELEPAGAAGG